ncbi:MAG: glycogen debranching protein GlgX [Burkholderiales bacterium]
MPIAGPGEPEPLGVTLQEGGVNVAVFSAHASAVEFCLFDDAGDVETARVPLPARTGDVWHGFVPGVAAGARYGLRAHGPWAPQHGQRFNAAKLLADPYARALDRPFALHRALLPPGPRERDDVDTAPSMPKGIVRPATPVAPDTRPRVPWAQTVIYELHVRGFTRTHPAVPEAVRGTCAGLAHPAAIAHLLRLGITTVELMPVAAWIDEPHLARAGLSNYWGYNPVALLVPDPRLAPGGIDELRDCVQALHAAGLEVILDVVLNHTGEGDALGPTLSFRGLDNAAYYRTVPGDRARYLDDAGCGNTLALERPFPLRLALDALRHYALAANVDGFRFDLATTLARRRDGFDPEAPILQAIAQDPVLRDRKLIAEPWDVGPGGHHLGAFPAPWGEWNDRYRDAVRRWWRGEPGLTGALATALAGSADHFAARARPPHCSVNFVCAHDGFTLADLVAHERKHNEANGEGNRDGTDANHSWNHGAEGETDDPRIRAARARDARNLLATLLLARGTPMLAMGDEMGRTQRGNNNAYAQDNVLAWIDWARVDEALVDHTATLVALRRALPALHDDRWLTGAPVDATGIPDVAWLRADGTPMRDADWSDPACRTLVALLYAGREDGAPVERVGVILNAGADPVAVRWPAAREDFAWQRRVDTGDAAAPADPGTVVVGARCVVVMVEAPLPPEVIARRRGEAVPAPLLERLASAAGIAPEWWEVSGTRHAVSPDTQRALLAALGLPTATRGDAHAHLATLAAQGDARPLPAAVTGREGAPVVVPLAGVEGRGRHWLHLRRADGQVVPVAVVPDALPRDAVAAPDGRRIVRRLLTLPKLPAGLHTLEAGDGTDLVCRILVAPRACHLPPALADGARRFGLAAHLYALRRADDAGIGDFTALADACRATARAGGSLVGVNPLHALFPQDRDRASPYHPSDRRFLDPLYIDVTTVPEFALAGDARTHYAQAAAPLRTLAHVDYPRSWDAKRAALDACFAAFERLPAADPRVAAFERFVAGAGPALARFALFEAIAAQHPRVPWQRWPAELRRPDTDAARAFAAAHARTLRCVQYLQWLADTQLGAAVEGSGLAIGLYRDLAVGAAPDGAEPWSHPDTFMAGVSIGAPPDPFARDGQVWSLPPPHPLALAQSACAPLSELLAANMRHAGALRIDHVMGLARLFVVPDGAAGADGAYLHYPLALQLAAVALASVRARCLVVGEDLGTVPDGLRDALAQSRVLSYRVLWFERDGPAFVPPARWPAQAAACASTHDLPTIAGWWNGEDIAERAALGQLPGEAADGARAVRDADRRALLDAMRAAELPEAVQLDADAPCTPQLIAAVHRYVDATPCQLALLQADDLAGETVALNLPATDRERPNWRRRVGVPADALWQTPVGMQAAADGAEVRAAATPTDGPPAT